MKKLLLPGVALVIYLVLCIPVMADSVADSSTPQSTPRTANRNYVGDSAPMQQPERIEMGSLPTPYVGRGATDLLGTRATNSLVFDGQQPGMEVIAFRNTFSLMNAVSLLNNSGVSLSCITFGRVPFQQLLLISATNPTSNIIDRNTGPTASLPEPASLLLLGTGLTALGAGMRRRKKNRTK